MADVLRWVEEQTGVPLPGQHLLAAVNVAHHVAMTAPVGDGDEVALSPTGGDRRTARAAAASPVWICAISPCPVFIVISCR